MRRDRWRGQVQHTRVERKRIIQTSTIPIRIMEEGEYWDAMHSKTTTPNDSHTKSHIINTCNILDPNTSAFFGHALHHKYDSPQSFIRVKCVSTRKKRDVNLSTYRSKPEVVDKIVSLWDKQQGKCALTGRSMVWRKEDIQRSPGSVISIGSIEGGHLWTEDTAILLCAEARTLVHFLGMNTAINVARCAVPFIELCTSHPTLTREEQLCLWDGICASHGETPWIFSQEIKNIVTRKFSDVRLYQTPGQKDRRENGEELAYINYCVNIMGKQKGRCAITGIPMDTTTWGVLKPSVDRIDCTKPHIEGNVQIVCYAINNARESQAIQQFWDLLVDVEVTAKKKLV
jgi:hypothetical protein